MTILWHSVKYPPKKDGDYYLSTTYTTSDEETGEYFEYRNIDTIHYTVEHGWNTYKHCSKSALTVKDTDQWAEVEHVSD